MSHLFSSLLLSAAVMTWAPSAQASSWKIDTKTSKISIIATINSASAQGQFEKFSAIIDFDPEDLTSANIKVDVDLTAVKMKDPQQTAILGSADWFNTAQYPMATFTSTTIKATGNNTFEMSATLTLKGKTLPVTLPFIFMRNSKKARATGEFTLMRNDFKVGVGQFSSGSTVGFEVKLMIDINAEQT